MKKIFYKVYRSSSFLGFTGLLTTLFLGLLLGQPAKAQMSPRQIEVLSLFQTLETHYAPLRYKEDYWSYDWDEEKFRWQEKLLSANSNREYFLGLAEFFGFLRDAHVSIKLPSSRVRELPIQFVYSKGKVLVNHIASSFRERNGSCPVRVGDHLVRMNGRRPMEILKEFSISQSHGRDKTDFMLGALRLAQIAESRGMDPKILEGDQSTALLYFERANFGPSFHCQVQWDVKGSSFLEEDTFVLNPIDKEQTWNEEWQPGEAHEKIQKYLKLIKNLFHLKADVGITLERSEAGEGTRFRMGAEEPFFELPASYKDLEVPKLFTPVLSLSNLKAGTFRHKGKTVGFLRIPSYVPSNLQASLFGLRYTIGKLEEITDYLVIDQTNNPGGYVVFSDWILDSFVDELDPDRHITFEMKPSLQMISNYQSLLQTIREDSTIESSLKAKYLPLFEKEYQKLEKAYKGNQFLTEPMHLYVSSEFMKDLIDSLINELLFKDFSQLRDLSKRLIKRLLGVDVTEKQVYSKPVYFHVNPLCFSGGDATPALFQDYQRATLLGATTAGAGGTVGEFRNHVAQQFSFRLTTGLMRRYSGAYVENNGVEPEISFELIPEDIEDGYSSYFERLMSKIK
jgi:hypothetical protein